MFTAFAFVAQQCIFAESSSPSLDKRCESLEMRQAINLPNRTICWSEKDACVEERMVSLGEPHEQAENYCWKQPLDVDPSFFGPCPLYLQELESDAYDSEEWVLPRINLRLRFKQLNERGLPTYESYKRTESVQTLRQLLDSDPNNLVVVTYLQSRLDRDDVVGGLMLEMKLHELDPDCPSHWRLRKIGIYNDVTKLADNWLTENGSGSELIVSERRELFQKARSTLRDMYDIAVEQERGTKRLYWALESIHDAVLSGTFRKGQQISRLLEINLDEFAEKRRKSLVHSLSREYGVKSKHGRTQSLDVMCNDYAFELGLANHCISLLEHFGRWDAKSRKGISIDWARAAILLTNGLTRDCSPYHVFLHGTPLWYGNRRCLTEGHEESVAQVKRLLGRLSHDGSSAERELLEAYLRLDKTSDERFLRALALDASIVPYAARLSKRLLKRDNKEAASNILSSINAEQIAKLDTAEKGLLEGVIDSYHKGSYRNSWERPRYALQLEHER